MSAMSADQLTRQRMSKLLDDFESAGGWVNREVFGLTSFGAMGYGAIALSEIASETVLFHIPLNMILSPMSSELRTKLSPNEWESLGHGWSPLILTMMWETSREHLSKFAYYLDAMPTDFDTPMMWEPSQVHELSGTDIEKRIGRAEAENEYTEKILPLLAANPDLFPASSPHFSIEAFHMHGSRILSRSFTVQKSLLDSDAQPNDDTETDSDVDDEVVTVMIPMADMLNAAYERDNARLYDDNEHELPRQDSKPDPGFTMVSSKLISIGEQIYNTYAAPPNSELLRKYGHVDELPLGSEVLRLLDEQEIGEFPLGNPGDEVEIEGSLVTESVRQLRPELAVHIDAKVDRWLEEGEEDSFYLSFDGKVNEPLLVFILVLLDETSWAKFRDKGKLPKPLISDEVHAIATDVIRRRLSRYTSTLSDDLSALSTADSRLRKAIIVRIGEQRVLLAALRTLDGAALSTGSKRPGIRVKTSTKRIKIQ